nr:outer membrane lipoprotein chaperone LolA [Moraxella bovoculi]
MTLPTIAQAAPASQQDAVKNLNRLLSNTKSMTANFSQTTKAGKKTNKFSGTMAVQRQNQFRWETKSPAEQLIVANGSTMWVYDKDLSQAIKQSTSNQVGDTPALLLSGDPAKIANNFNVSQPNSAKNYFKLTPKGGNAGFNELYISFNGGKPVLMVLNDTMGQRTDIRFSNISLNKKINASQFSFTPPRGVEVINQ